MSNPQAAAQGIDQTNLAQSSQAILIQAYANSVNEQPPVDFSGDSTLVSYATQINAGLVTAQGHASNYLTVVQPAIIQNIANIGNYYALNNAVPTALPVGSTEAQWISALQALQTQAVQYQTSANTVVSSIQSLHENLTADAAAFATTVTELNTAVGGDNGVLADINTQLSSLQTQIDGAIAGAVVSGLTIAGGAFMIAVGGIAEFVTGGTSTALVLAGIGVVAAGVGGEVGSAIALKTLLDDKAAVLQKQVSLTAEVQLATGISSGYQSLSTQILTAVTAATAMANAWGFLSSDLGSMISDLQSGIQSADETRTLFLDAANNQVQTVIRDIGTIKGQMAGVTVTTAQQGQTVGQTLVAMAQQLSTAAAA